MRLRFKSMLAFVGVLIILCSAVGVGYLFYKEVIVGSDIIVDGDLTINYLNGKKFNLEGEKTIEFSVTNNSDDQKYYYIQLMDVHASNVTYNLKSTSNLDIKNELKSDIISNQIAINGNETVNYSLTFNSDSNDRYSGVIQIGSKENDENTFINAILINNNVSDTVLSNIGESSTLDEGLIPMQDDQGLAYYFRGNVTNNNVLFAGMNWKIVKINGDSTIKLVLDGIIPNLSKYYDGDTGYDVSSIKSAVEEWFDTSLNDFTEYIAYYKFCNDNVLDSDGKSYIAYTRLITNKIPTFMCLGSSINTKVGLLTADEVMLAGGSEKANKEYYLYNSNIETSYYTMSSGKMLSNVYYPFVVSADGALVTNVSGTLLRGVRPVINIVRNARVTGNGTIENPYEISLN